MNTAPGRGEQSQNDFEQGRLARALVREAPVMLLDEPTTYLDHHSQADLIELVAGIRKARKLSLITISHNPDHLEKIADVTLLLERGRMREKP